MWVTDGVRVYEFKTIYQREELEGWYLRDRETRVVVSGPFKDADAADWAECDQPRPCEVIFWHSSGKQSVYCWYGNDIGWFPKEGI